MGKLTISTAIFHSYGSLPEGKWWSIIDLLGFNGSYPRVNQHMESPPLVLLFLQKTCKHFRSYVSLGKFLKPANNIDGLATYDDPKVQFRLGRVVTTDFFLGESASSHPTKLVQ